MANWHQPFRPPAVDTAGGGISAPDLRKPVGVAELRAAASAIGTTLDEGTTCLELTRAAVAQAGGAAAVLPAGRAVGSGYEAVSGNPCLLPEAGQAGVVVCGSGEPAEGGAVSWSPGGGRTALSVPLVTGSHSYGTLVCARAEAPFTRAEADHMAFLAERAASHIRHAREHDAVSSIVGKLQRALLAEPGRPHPNLDVAIRYLPVGQSSLVGGDWCETVRLHFGRTLLVVGDVMGHGLEAAVDMTAYRSSLRYIASADLPPHRVLRQLDEMASGEPDRRPATCLLARLDPNRGQVTLASAGHLPPVVIDGEGRASLLPVPVGPPLGTGLGGYEPATYRLAPGQTLMLFTDGLVEHRGEDIDQSLDRLTGVGFGTASGVEQVLDTVVARLDVQQAEDDVAVLAARIRDRRTQD
ncbi:SpoIIE family protein phosphatase [Streptomyces actinomycinicus]|uniref:SpoIIE family protein phosphatase n=1 Tax=Streptomyces actinomycinicus TaxID=1695166 RepID=A0A937EHJ9_9ACTN|nr:GAF domain-containing SpoIIE family protein phosphatase [Streptomyces actinomycinicus]MBL1082532.1 SpoIIE family protein phosphatase [Streptomyces actinomycinicus]